MEKVANTHDALPMGFEPYPKARELSVIWNQSIAPALRQIDAKANGPEAYTAWLDFVCMNIEGNFTLGNLVKLVKKVRSL